MPPKKPWYVKGGTQSCLGVSYRPAELINKLKASAAAWTKQLDPILEDDDEGEQQCVLKCKKCERVFSPSNPSDTYKTHSDPTVRSYCTGLAADQAKMVRELEQQEDGHAPSA